MQHAQGGVAVMFGFRSLRRTKYFVFFSVLVVIAGLRADLPQEVITLPAVQVTVDIIDIGQARALIITLSKEAWSEVGDAYDNLSLPYNGPGEYSAAAVTITVCIGFEITGPCFPSVLQSPVQFIKRPGESFSTTLKKAFDRGELPKNIHIGPATPAGDVPVGTYNFGPGYCIYGGCGGGIGTTICGPDENDDWFCIHT